MIRHTAVSLLMTLLVALSLANSAHAAVQLYSGRMEILVTSGKGCDGLAKTHDVSLAISEEDGTGGLYGYFIGGGITIGRFSGKDPAHLEVRYPYHDEQRAAGHTMSLSRTDTTLVVELHDRHVDAAADDCNFDLARMELSRSVDDASVARLTQMNGLFDAQLTRSQAMAMVQSSGYEAAVPYFEKALDLADRFLPKGGEQIDSYLVGLATCYIWLDRLDDFNRLYDTRLVSIQDESVRSIFSGYRVRPLLTAGRAAFGREEYDAALKNFEQAYKLQPQNKDVIAAVLSVYIHNGRYAEAVSFLERAESTLESEVDRKEIRIATAMVLYKKAQKEDKADKDPEAEKDLKRATELDPDSAYYIIALARMRHKAGSLADADKLLDQGLKRFTDVQTQNEINAAREKLHQTEMILQKIRKAGS